MATLAFFGTPEFAVPSLDALLELQQSGHNVALVVCQPDKPKGRGKKIVAPPVKERALQAERRVAQPTTLKAGTPDGEAFFSLFQELKIDLAVVAAYGRIFPNRLLSLPPFGFLNVHASLLPRWRGAAPIHRAIEAGDPSTGVALMDMVFALDAGDVYASEETKILANDDAVTLTDKLARMGHDMLLTHIPQILDGSLPKTPQPEDGITYAQMLKKSDGQINWRTSATQICNHARAMSPWPGTFTTYQGAPLKLFMPTIVDANQTGLAPGTILPTPDRLEVQTARGIIRFEQIQMQSRKKVAVEDFLRGHSFATGTVLGETSVD
jgi:methionyl-tRNA formyltransferase